MLIKIRTTVLFALTAAMPLPAFSDMFEIAAIVAKGEHQSASAKEKICVYEGLIEHSKKSGLPVQITYYDNERSSLKSEFIANEIAKTNANVVLGSLLSSEALPAAKILETAKIPFVVNGTTPELTNNRKYVVGLFANDYMQARILAEYAATFNPKKVLIIENTSDEYSVFLAKEFSSQILEIVPETQVSSKKIFKNYPFFDDIAKSVIMESPDLIFAPLYNPDISQLYLSLDKAKNRSLVLGSDSVGGRREFYDLIGNRSKFFDLHFVANFSGTFAGNYELFKKIFDASCRPRGFKEPSYVGAAAFDVLNSVIEMVKREGVVEREYVVNKLNAQPYEGLLGTSEFQKGGTRKTMYILKIGNGENEFVTNL